MTRDGDAAAAAAAAATTQAAWRVARWSAARGARGGAAARREHRRSWPRTPRSGEQKCPHHQPLRTNTRAPLSRRLPRSADSAAPQPSRAVAAPPSVSRGGCVADARASPQSRAAWLGRCGEREATRRPRTCPSLAASGWWRGDGACCWRSGGLRDDRLLRAAVEASTQWAASGDGPSSATEGAARAALAAAAPPPPCAALPCALVRCAPADPLRGPWSPPALSRGGFRLFSSLGTSQPPRGSRARGSPCARGWRRELGSPCVLSHAVVVRCAPPRWRASVHRSHYPTPTVAHRDAFTQLQRAGARCGARDDRSRRRQRAAAASTLRGRTHTTEALGPALDAARFAGGRAARAAPRVTPHSHPPAAATGARRHGACVRTLPALLRCGTRVRQACTRRCVTAGVIRGKGGGEGSPPPQPTRTRRPLHVRPSSSRHPPEHSRRGGGRRRRGRGARRNPVTGRRRRRQRSPHGERGGERESPPTQCTHAPHRRHRRRIRARAR